MTNQIIITNSSAITAKKYNTQGSSLDQKCSENQLFSFIFDILPDSITASLPKDIPSLNKITEIRLRAGGASTASHGADNLIISKNGLSKTITDDYIRLTEADIDDFIYRLCQGSVYSYEKQISKGYITFGGVRVGISGEMFENEGGSWGFTKITAVNIRLPRHYPQIALPVLEHIEKYGFDDMGGILVISPPGLGKTTVLRELAIRLSSGISYKMENNRIFRVSVIDERCEIYIPCLFNNSSADVFCGVSKGVGIEMASRTMSPQIIIFDELSNQKEIEEVVNAHYGGITFIASVHGDSVEAVTSKKLFSPLFEQGVFSYAFLLKRYGQTPSISGQLFPLQHKND